MSDGLLTDMRCRKAACPPDKKKTRITDGGGLFLMVTAAGGKYWGMAYRMPGVRRELSFGTYPKVSLKEARQMRDRAREMIRNGIDPRDARDMVAAPSAGSTTTFAQAFEDYLQHRGRNLTDRTLREMRSRMRCHALPHIGDTPISDIRPDTILAVLRRIERGGRHHTAHKVRAIIGRVMRFAIASGLIDTDPTASLVGALEPERVTHRATLLDPAAIGGLMRAIHGYEGHPAVVCAMRLLPLLFVRPGELRHMEWREVDLDAARWTIPAARLKIRGRGDHIVPLSRQAVEILRAQHELSGHRDLVMPGLRSGKPLSDATYNATLRTIGYDGTTQTAHGFRAMARSLLAEHGWPTEAIERQLAHAGKDMVARAYARAQHLDLRTGMMQAWADYLDLLRADDLPAAAERLMFEWRQEIRALGGGAVSA